MEKNKCKNYSITNKESFSILQVAKLFKSKINFLPKREGERYASALTSMSLSNKVYKNFGKISLRNYIENFLKNNQKSKFFLIKDSLHLTSFRYNTTAGDYCESVIPDPIPNSEVKPFCADGTLS